MIQNLVRVLARQSAHPVGLIPFATVEAGEAAVQQAMGQLAAEGKGAAIVDTVLDRHLQAIGAAALQNPISVGASGLGLGPCQGVDRGEALHNAAGCPPRPNWKSAERLRFLPAVALRRRWSRCVLPKTRCLFCGWMSRGCWRASPSPWRR